MIEYAGAPFVDAQFIYILLREKLWHVKEQRSDVNQYDDVSKLPRCQAWFKRSCNRFVTQNCNNDEKCKYCGIDTAEKRKYYDA